MPSVFLGGVPKTLVIDNLRAAVTRADWYDPELNAKVAEFCQHYGTVMLATRPAMPQHKGKIEAGVKFAQNNALKGRSFNSLAEQNLFLTEWESSVADTRIHGTTRQQVGKVFNEVERPKLSPLPAGLFPVFEEAPRTVHSGRLHRVCSGPIIRCRRSMWAAQSGRGGSPGWCASSSASGSHRHPCARRAGQVCHGSEPCAFPVSADRRTRPGLSAGPGAADWRAHRQFGPKG